MPLFYVHILQDDERLEDTDGTEFADVEAARAEAIASATELLAARIIEAKPIAASAVELRDATGGVVDVIPFRDLIRYE